METEEYINMNTAASEAFQEFINMLDHMPPEEAAGALKVCKWFVKWFPKAYHKRLGRILLEIGKTR